MKQTANMIEIQDAYIHRVNAAQGTRRAALARGAATTVALRQLLAAGFSRAQAVQAVEDAHDVAMLQRNAQEVL